MSSFPQKYDQKTLLQLLGDDHLHIVDVGATGGPHPRWRPIGKKCRFTTFDPDPRATSGRWKIENHPYGLWSKPCKRQLNLAYFPEASSLYPFHPNLETFSNASCHRIVDTTTIELKTLDQLVSHCDILKIDAEGAELEILKGGEALLKNGCFAIDIELSFLERYEGAPLFHEIDTYLRKLGFQLHQLHREHWIRKNRTHYCYSKPQLIWGNALYIRRKDLLPKKSTNKIGAALLLYHYHDLVDELCDPKIAEKACTPSLIYFIKLIASLFIGVTGFILFSPSPSIRHKFREYLRDRTRELGHIFLNLSKSGPCNCSVYDQP
ncbi:MAG: hypothetical protein S4CHLAM45_01930 [Chlamydiales bacterium]|nr:hypothetical protein [Chlamydiales bacterium]MCH9619512.1 hypothetical protein [Chlamydiales bacterium]MCH9622316.1 hypothetical protein [Chlamydiales bacterium]